MQPRDDRGSATAEAAVVLPAVVVVLALMVWGIGVAGAQLRCIDAARAAARAAARGESAGATVAAARDIAPADAHVGVRREGERVSVVVTATVRPPGPVLSRLGAIAVRGWATGAAEPG
jgi:Flp pilus assembly protein TadG